MGTIKSFIGSPIVNLMFGGIFVALISNTIMYAINAFRNSETRIVLSKVTVGLNILLTAILILLIFVNYQTNTEDNKSLVLNNANALPFSDVPTNAWYYDSVAYVHENGIMKGTTDTAFSPDIRL
ncbi:MAG: S-layer homology domain-containing protein [Clostridiales Family XIII bacterium]|jgi:hypothetical protein|nr:S-layer homology domain-containing protein [Clostridiales Family XIII bacterium]